MFMYNSYIDRDNCREEKKERKFDLDESCVVVNIFCDEKKKEHKPEDECRDDYKKEYERKDEKNCVTVNIFCEKCKKE